MTPAYRDITVRQIAMGLSTVPRWNGRTILDRVGFRWSVLQHSLVCGALAQHMGFSPVVVAYALLHDAEETHTGDTPKPFKTVAQAELGDQIRRDIHACLGLPKMTDATRDAVGQVDESVRHAEAHVLMKPGTAEIKRRVSPETLFAIDQVWGLLDLDVRAGIEMFTDTVEAVLEDPNVKTLKSRV